MRNLSVIKGLYQGNGVTRRWAIPFEYNDKSQIFVTITTYDEGDYTYRVLDSTEYTIDEDSVEIVYPKTDDDAPIPSTKYLTVWRDTDLLQLVDLTNQGAAWPDSIEGSLDKLHQIVQELAEGLSRALKVDIGDPQTPDEKLIAIQDYVLAAAESSRSASSSAVSANQAAESAATSAANAAESERLAGGYADTATDAASRAEDSAISARAYNAPDYDNAKTYQAGDVVTFTDGNSYRALQETTGNEPPNIIYWQKVTDYVGDDFFEVDEYGYIVPMDSPSHSRYWRVDQNGYIVPIEGGDGGYRPDTRSLSAEYLNVTNEGYIKHLRADDVNAGMLTTLQANVTALTANAVNAGTVTANDIIAKGPVVDVRAFGAKGDGVTDDTAAFRSALLAAQGKTLVVPQGSYLINENLFADNVNEVIDNGIYTNIKPCYPDEKIMMFKGIDYIRYKTCLENVSTYGTPQGCCYDAKTNKILVACIVSDTDPGEQSLLIIDPSDYTFTTKSYTNLRHAGSLVYVPETEKIYVGAGGFPYVFVLDAVTYEYESMITLSHNVSYLGWDSDCKFFVAGTYGGKVPDDASRGIFNYYIYDSAFNLIRNFDVSFEKKFGGRNGIACKNGHICQLGMDWIAELDCFGNIYNKVDFNQGFEFEDLDFYNGDLLISSLLGGSDAFYLYKANTSDNSAENAVADLTLVNNTYYNRSLNQIKSGGIFRVSVDNASDAQTKHYPKSSVTGNYATAGILHNIRYMNDTDSSYDASIIKQYFYRTALSHEIYYRYYILSSGWGDWIRIDGQGAMPNATAASRVYISGASSGMTYTATADGYLHFDANFNSLNITGSNVGEQVSYEDANFKAHLKKNVFIKKGQTLTIRYLPSDINFDNTTNYMWFAPMN